MEKIIEQMAHLQHALNSKIHPEWYKQGNDWDTAIMVESAELSDSLQWKWWKNMDDDWSNVEVELVDLFHFILSKMIEKNKMNIVNKVITRALTTFQLSKPIDDNDMKRELVLMFNKSLVQATLEDKMHDAIMYWYKMWLTIGKTKEDILKQYFVKNILNTFRQDNGYKDGSYIKEWVGKDGRKYEDNVIAFYIADDLKLDDTFPDEFAKALDEVYADTKIHHLN